MSFQPILNPSKQNFIGNGSRCETKDDIRQFCVSRGVPFMTVRSDERVEEVLVTRGCVEELIQ